MVDPPDGMTDPHKPSRTREPSGASATQGRETALGGAPRRVSAGVAALAGPGRAREHPRSFGKWTPRCLGGRPTRGGYPRVVRGKIASQPSRASRVHWDRQPGRRR